VAAGVDNVHPPTNGRIKTENEHRVYYYTTAAHNLRYSCHVQVRSGLEAARNGGSVAREIDAFIASQ
jgi:hypothetical protein